jgi:hypothetical protein
MEIFSPTPNPNPTELTPCYSMPDRWNDYKMHSSSYTHQTGIGSALRRSYTEFMYSWLQQ